MSSYRNLKTVLYHGTLSEIRTINVTKGRGYKDFGKGFYMAESRQQAVGIMHKKYRDFIKSRPEDKANVREILYEIHLNESILKTLDIKIFSFADIEWLDFVLMCRGNKGMPHDFDLVVGPTADDDTMAQLNAFRQGFLGDRSSVEVKKMLLKTLEPENLGIQYFIGKQEVADKLVKEIKEVKR